MARDPRPPGRGARGRSMRGSHGRRRNAEDVARASSQHGGGLPADHRGAARARDDVFGACAKRWLDVGGGDGTVARTQLLRETIRSACDVFNLPSVAPLVTARAAVPGSGPARVRGRRLSRRAAAARLRRAVVHTRAARLARGRRAHAAREGQATRSRRAAGSSICEEFRTHDRLAVQLFWTYFLDRRRRVREPAARGRVVHRGPDDLGFTDIRVMSGAFDVVVAVRP